jgi:hypothetical protein
MLTAEGGERRGDAGTRRIEIHVLAPLLPCSFASFLAPSP